MTFDELNRARLNSAALSAGLREVASTGRAALSAIASDASRARQEIGATERATRSLSGALASGLSRALRSAVLDGAKLSDVLRSLALDVARGTASRAIDAASGQLAGTVSSGLAKLFPFERGGVVTSGRIRTFARGGVLDGPTLFPMARGAGLAGEAGPEAILPLQRGTDGRLGVAARTTAAPTVIVNISTPDADSFRRSRGQIAATLARAVDRGRRNL